ncbi:MAG: metallophosphoesterase [Candidatus Cyclobacteriaceae bacterium M2_1C_046]
MNNKHAGLYFLILVFISVGCSTVKPYYSNEMQGWQENELPDESQLEHVVYLLGDAGEEEYNPNYELVNKMIMQEKDSASSIVWMGDNVYYDGLPDVDEPDRKEKEEVLLRQMRVADSTYTGNVIFVPGNHDWNESLAGGLAAVNRQEEFVERYYNGRNTFLPSNGCAGPVQIPVSDNLVIIAVDSEWWSHKYLKSRYPDNGCTVADKIDLVIQMEDEIRRSQNKNVLIVAHHPLMSNSSHGGHFNLMDHIFPLRLVRDHLYIPLPLIGSLYPLLRKLGVSAQDIPSPEGQQWKDAILSMAAHRPNVIYAAGHDHNLQLHKYGSMHHIISGSASKTTYAARRFGASYVQQKKGFCRLLYYNDGQVWIQYYTVNDDNPEGTLTLQAPLYSFKAPEIEHPDYERVPDYRDSIKTISANPDYDISQFAETFIGGHYRREWITPVTAPYLDVKTFAGGLSPIKKEGRKQKLSVRLTNGDSVQFLLRSVEKFPEKAIPAQFRKTWMNDVLDNQISTAHPYATLTIPKMADAIDIFYTRPMLVYTPHTPYLEQYEDQIGGMLGMIEPVPEKDLSEYIQFGSAESIRGSENMFKHLANNSENRVDQRLFLKSRLFDMIIGDWERHEDQWLWAEYKTGEGSLFKPIPRDHDQAYAKYDGLIPWLLSRRWGFRNFVSFEHEVNDVKELNQVAQNLDRMILNELTREDWHRVAIEIQIQLSDLVIESAIKDMPPEVFPYSGDEIISKLKSRRDEIIDIAMNYYDFLSKEAYIVTSHDPERYEITRDNNDSTTVEIFKITEEGEVGKQLYQRVFLSEETQELRIFSRGGNDHFIINGNVEKGIPIKIVGGEGSDEFNVDAEIEKSGKSVHIFDNDTANVFNVNDDTKLTLDNKMWVNQFSRDLYKYDYSGPRFTFQHNIDDGLFLGLGFKLERHGFRSDPYKATHFFMGHYAFNTESSRFLYQGQFYNFFKYKWDLRLNADYYGPEYVFNYFGFGNNTDFDESRGINFYQIRMEALLFEPSFVHRFSPAWNFGFGPMYEYFDIHENENTILGENTADPFVNISPTSFVGGKMFSEIELVEELDNPQKGMRWYNEAQYHYEIDGGDAQFTSLDTELSFYFTPNLPFNATFAFRVGAGTNIGDFYFYQSKYLGGVTNLRGHRRSRFAGRTNFFNNNEVRLDVFRIRNVFVSGDIGAIAFYDLGKVWTDDGQDSEWHNSYGPGIYFNIYNLFVLSGTYGISEENKLFNFRVGFLF